MFNQRLFAEIKNEKYLIGLLFILKLMDLLANVAMIFAIAAFLQTLILDQVISYQLILIFLGIIVLRSLNAQLYARTANQTSRRIQGHLRQKLFDQVYAFKLSFASKISISEVIALGVDGIEQLQLFYGQMLPQLAFSLLGPVILFFILATLNLKLAATLLLVVPLIPVAIMMVQQLAKRVVKTYWKSYTNLSEVFVDFLEGLTTLKVFGADEEANDFLNQEAEDFRQKTMKLLMVQLNNITAMDLVAYGGTALGILLTLKEYQGGNLTLFVAISFILLSQEFFTPLRQLGALFHVAMNGISSANSLYDILDMEVNEDSGQLLSDEALRIEVQDLSFAYETDKVLDGINLSCKPGEITAFVGASGSGKSTLAQLISQALQPTAGSIAYNGCTQPSIKSLIKHQALIDHQPYFFSQSLAYNLRLAKETASDQELIEVLQQVKLWEYFRQQECLETVLDEGGANLSGGQKQRLAIARVLLKRPRLLILDEAISNIDLESEEAILEVLVQLKDHMTIILITHRLRATQYADTIYFLQDEQVVESGSFDQLQSGSYFAELYQEQMALESWDPHASNH